MRLVPHVVRHRKCWRLKHARRAGLLQQGDTLTVGVAFHGNVVDVVVQVNAWDGQAVLVLFTLMQCDPVARH